MYSRKIYWCTEKWKPCVLGRWVEWGRWGGVGSDLVQQTKESLYVCSCFHRSHHSVLGSHILVPHCFLPGGKNGICLNSGLEEHGVYLLRSNYQMIDGHLKINLAWGQIPCFLYYATLPQGRIKSLDGWLCSAQVGKWEPIEFTLLVGFQCQNAFLDHLPIATWS